MRAFQFTRKTHCPLVKPLETWCQLHWYSRAWYSWWYKHHYIITGSWVACLSI